MKRNLLFLTMIATAILLFTTQVNHAEAAIACTTEHFIDVQPHAANSAYPDPELTVACGGTSLSIQSNGIPNYEFVQVGPNAIQEQNHSWSIPLTPSGAMEDIPLLGTAGVLVNGIPVFGPNEAANLGWGDPYLDGVLDFCNGHPGGRGDYHNHAPPECIFSNYENNVGLVVGYSLDGWPILAPFECADASCSSVVELQSSWQVTNASATAAWDMHSYVSGSGDLDQCNGKVQPDGSYAYYSTASFPYFLGCFVNGEYDSTSATTTTTDSGDCVIPASGPWPTCATGGGTATTATTDSGDCVIPASGPWPTCATNGSGGTATTATADSGDCVIPASGPWPTCATNGSGGTATTTTADSGDCVIPASGPWPTCATSGATATPADAPTAGGAEDCEAPPEGERPAPPEDAPADAPEDGTRPDGPPPCGPPPQN